MNLRKPDRLAGAGFAAKAPPAPACASAPDEPTAGAGNPAPAGAVTARDAVPASGPAALDSSTI